MGPKGNGGGGGGGVGASSGRVSDAQLLALLDEVGLPNLAARVHLPITTFPAGCLSCGINAIASEVWLLCGQWSLICTLVKCSSS
jgi:hypothetical protein